jgi:oligopeptide/dipeptide ABC transporter ATP-binding protein
MNQSVLLQVNGLRVDVGRSDSRVRAVRGASLMVRRGSRLGVIGESGSGKTMMALATLRLLPATGMATGGEVLYGGRDLLQLSEEEMQRVRGKEISMVFQNAVSALNPLFPVGQQIADVYRYHEGASGKEAREKAIAMLDAMGIPDPARRARAYPHQYSGGMAQRAMIAMALVCSPQLLIADEPTTGLDLTIQAQVLDLIKEHIQRSEASLLIISHDIAVVAESCTDVAVMYAGEVLEAGSLEDVLGEPSSPYTKALLECFDVKSGERLSSIAGQVPDLRSELVGCPFASRCKLVQDICRQEHPTLRETRPKHWVACHFA